MLWEMLFGVPVWPEAPAALLIVFDMLPIGFSVMLMVMLFYMRYRMAPWKEVIDSTGKTLGIFVDMGNRVHFVNLSNSKQYDILKNWGFFSVNAKAMYRAAKQNCHVGIWSTKACVPLPAHLAPVAQATKSPGESMVDALKRKYGDQDVVVKRLPTESQKEKEQQEKEIRRLKETFSGPAGKSEVLSKSGELKTAMFYQLMVDEWDKWLGNLFNPVLLKMEVADKARSLANLDSKLEQKQKMNWKMLIILFIIMGVAGVALLFML